jgi:hypothetical protein
MFSVFAVFIKRFSWNATIKQGYSRFYSLNWAYDGRPGEKIVVAAAK